MYFTDYNFSVVNFEKCSEIVLGYGILCVSFYRLFRKQPI